MNEKSVFISYKKNDKWRPVCKKHVRYLSEPVCGTKKKVWGPLNYGAKIMNSPQILNMQHTPNHTSEDMFQQTLICSFGESEC